MASSTDDPLQERKIRLMVLAACVLAHGVLGAWLMREPVRGSVADSPLQVEFIPAVPAARVPPPPPFPQAPSRPRTQPRADTARATPSAPPDPPAATTSAAAPQRMPDTMQILDAIRAESRAQAERAMPLERDPTQRYVPRVPGRAEPYTPNAIVLRPAFTPEDVLRLIGTLFGGNYNPCPDTQSKIRDLAARNERIGEEELQILIDRERRRCR